MNAVEQVAESFAGVVKRFRQDWEALPADAKTKSHGGKARKLTEVVAECALVNKNLALSLTGQEPRWEADGDWNDIFKEYEDPEKAWAFHTEMAERVDAAIRKLDPDSFFDIPEGEGQRSMFQLANFAVFHLNYHGGQLTYVQSLLGDDKMHWS